MGSIKVNGEWLVEEQEVKEGIVNSFQQLLTEDMAWQADIGNIQVGCISQQDAECIEVPFVENEIHSALMEMNGDKAPGPDGFSVAFWQNAWAFAKEEIMEMFKEFHEHSTFVRSLNNTFLVLIPKKSGAEDLGDFRPISLLGGLYKLLAKVLANRLKRVIGKVVFSAQNAFVMGRQILDASLIANEVIDSWQKRKEKGLICKLDIEKAYDSINWNFLMKVLQKMGFGNKWVGWMWSCVSSTKFSILVNGVPAGFFPSSRGLRQGDPLSPYLFVMGMEILDVLIRRAVEGGYLSGCNIRMANKDQVSHLSWILFWFEAASGLRMNLAKSEIIPVGEVEEIQELAAELGCRVGSLPSHYLGLPLGVPNRASSMWDGVEERIRRRLALWKRQYISKGGRITLIKSALASMPIYQMSIFRMPKSVARRVEKIQRDFLWGGGNLGGKIHLVKWDVVCTEKRNGGLGLRRIATLNRALLGKWIWRFACERDNLWKQVISTKYGQEDYGWRAKKVSGAAGVGVWKEIMKESDWCWENLSFLVGKGSKIKFWKDRWCTDTPLSQCFNHLFVLAVHRDASIEEMWDHHSGQGDWNLIFERDFNDWELDMVGDLLRTVRGHRPSLEDDSIKWRQGRNGSFRVKEAYRLLDKSNVSLFPARGIWVDRVPTKVSFFAWEATWGKVLTLDKLQIRGVQLPNYIKWVFPETVKEALTSWRGSFVGKKRKQIWKSIPLCIFWTVWKERNRKLMPLSHPPPSLLPMLPLAPFTGMFPFTGMSHHYCCCHSHQHHPILSAKPSFVTKASSIVVAPPPPLFRIIFTSAAIVKVASTWVSSQAYSFLLSLSQAIAVTTCVRDSWPVLVLTPSSLRLHWASMIQQWLNIPSSDILIAEIQALLIGTARHGVGQSFVVLSQWSGSNRGGFRIVPSNTKGTIHLDGVFNIISYDVVLKLQKILAESEFKVVIADESHFLKNAQAKRTSASLPVLQVLVSLDK
ncbi:LINE-1 reverse transcriptase-like [Vitis vinifera]|uniref:LINE-1 reverse transcriptase-like n=1 Tax=Vitis vinifera TaxID=29760 RepID=A0A438KMA5_VITVI|nr:LINE-1 reverse transcriptase-like [Vitis vinifera]